ncbi:MAG: Ankyrin repeat (many copies), partial [Rickettsiaceae bacterium]|nr:Ankyrin repeat (many copies) [Rickettsiaceae bacterium]
MAKSKLDNLIDIIKSTNISEEDCIKKIQQELKESPKLISETNGHKATLIHYAVQCDKVEVIKTLKELGTDLEAKDTKGATALHYAAAYG